jgi:hypothetical protein
MLFVADPPLPSVLPPPAWRTLYATLAVIVTFGAAAIVATAGPLRALATAAAGLACFAAIAVWIRCNAVALARDSTPTEMAPLWPFDAR